MCAFFKEEIDARISAKNVFDWDISQNLQKKSFLASRK